MVEVERERMGGDLAGKILLHVAAGAIDEQVAAECDTVAQGSMLVWQFPPLLAFVALHPHVALRRLVALVYDGRSTAPLPTLG